MNKARRDKIEVIVGKLEDLREQTQVLHDEEEEAADAIPENMTAKKEAADDYVDNLDEAMNNIQEAIDSLSKTQGE